MSNWSTSHVVTPLGAELQQLLRVGLQLLTPDGAGLRQLLQVGPSRAPSWSTSQSLATPLGAGLRQLLLVELELAAPHGAELRQVLRVGLLFGLESGSTVRIPDSVNLSGVGNTGSPSADSSHSSSTSPTVFKLPTAAGLRPRSALLLRTRSARVPLATPLMPPEACALWQSANHSAMSSAAKSEQPSHGSDPTTLCLLQELWPECRDAAPAAGEAAVAQLLTGRERHPEATRGERRRTSKVVRSEA